MMANFKEAENRETKVKPQDEAQHKEEGTATLAADNTIEAEPQDEVLREEGTTIMSVAKAEEGLSLEFASEAREISRSPSDFEGDAPAWVKGLYHRFDRMDQRLNNIDHKFIHMEQQIIAEAQQLEHLQADHLSKTTVLDNRLEEIKQELKSDAIHDDIRRRAIHGPDKDEVLGQDTPKHTFDVESKIRIATMGRIFRCHTARSGPGFVCISLPGLL